MPAARDEGSVARRPRSPPYGGLHPAPGKKLRFSAKRDPNGAVISAAPSGPPLQRARVMRWHHACPPAMSTRPSPMR
eukprot:5388491-Prymnesium_polylepis.1